MGTYYIPRNVKGETRILYIFTIKALITTAVAGLIGFILLKILSVFGLDKVGYVLMAILALIGYAIGAVKIPTLSGVKITKKIGGEPLSEIILRYIKFKKNRKKYVYVDTKEEGTGEE